MEIKIGALLIGLLSLSWGIFKCKDIDTKLTFFWVSFVLITQSFSKALGTHLWLICVAIATILVGIFQGIRKKDKTYILLVGTIAILVMDLLFLKCK